MVLLFSVYTLIIILLILNDKLLLLPTALFVFMVLPAAVPHAY